MLLRRSIVTAVLFVVMLFTLASGRPVARSAATTGSITGSVASVSNGTPIGNMEVQLFSAGGTLLGGTNTDASGAYAFSGVAAGSYYLRTNGKTAFIDELYNDIPCLDCDVAATGGTPVPVVAGSTTTNINFVLGIGGRIAGQVTDADDFTPLQNVVIQVFSSAGQPMGTASTDASGHYTTRGLPSGSHFVRTNNTLGFIEELYDDIPCPGSGCDVTTGTPIAVTFGGTSSGVNFGLEAGGWITGTVTNGANGDGLPNVAVQVLTNTGILLGAVTTDNSGHYTTSGLSAGTYHVRTVNLLGYLDELYDDIPCAGCDVTMGTPIAVTVGAAQSGINFVLSEGGGSIAGMVAENVAGLSLKAIPVHIFNANGVEVKTVTSDLNGEYVATGLPPGTYYARTAVLSTQLYVDELYNGQSCFPSCDVTTGTAITVVDGATQGGIHFSLAANFVRNGRFDNSTTNWTLFAAPDPEGIIWQITNGVFEYYRPTPPPGTTNQAVVFQETGKPVAAHQTLIARFSLGNSSSVRKRISVLVLDSDFSDLSVCTFWLPPNLPLTSYVMKTRTTKVPGWANAAIYFYAASAGSNGGFYQLDNVSLEHVPFTTSNGTECVDPRAPVAPGGAAGANLLGNSNFFTGNVAPWNAFGTITYQIVGGVFEFIRNPGLPAGVVLQQTFEAMDANQIMTATFQLGNSSTVRKRVTVILHDFNFNDLHACTFWLPPGLPLSDYAVQTYATVPWANATLSLYGATVGPEQWIRLDNATFRRTPASPITGTHCLEPGATPLMNLQQMQTAGAALAGGASAAADRVAPSSRDVSAGLGETAIALAAAIDLRSASGGTLAFRSWLSAGPETMAEVQVSIDGVNWMTVGAARPSDDWEAIEIDLGGFAGQIVHVRLVITSHGARDRHTAVWRIGDLDVR